MHGTVLSHVNLALVLSNPFAQRNAPDLKRELLRSICMAWHGCCGAAMLCAVFQALPASG